MILPASTRVTELSCEVAGATSAPTVAVAGELPPDPADVSLRYEGLDQLLGIHIEPATADEILTRFGIERLRQVSNLPPAPNRKLETCAWTIPSYRRDLEDELELTAERI